MQGIGQAGTGGRMSAASGQVRETDWMRTRGAFDLPPTQPVDWQLWYGGLTEQDLEVLAAISWR